MRLYQLDSYATRFQARVERAWSDPKGHHAVLSQTLFYPESGGQPADTGVLRGPFGEVRVLHAYEEEKAFGDVVHVLSAPVPEGVEVEGEIDWPRRFRHMQRHTAQHLLSQALLRAGGYHTVAVSLDSPVCTVDLEEEAEEEGIQKAEALANFAVYADYPVEAFFVSEEELAQYPLRRPPKVRGKVRLVRIGDFDLAACGGTHLKTSAQAGPIKVLRWERYKGGTRVYFAAGWEALEDYHAKHALLSRLALAFSTHPLELEKPIKRLQEELYALKGENLALGEALVEALLPGPWRRKPSSCRPLFWRSWPRNSSPGAGRPSSWFLRRGASPSSAPGAKRSWRGSRPWGPRGAARRWSRGPCPGSGWRRPWGL